MFCFDSDSSCSDSDSSRAGSYFSEDIRYPHVNTTLSHSKASKKRTWSETDDESDLPGVPDYMVSGSSHFCSESDSDEQPPEEDSQVPKRRRGVGTGQPVAPVAGGVRHWVKSFTPAPKPTTAVRGTIGRKIPSNLGSGLKTIIRDTEYLTLKDPSAQNDSEFESVPRAVRPTQPKPLKHTVPAPKPTTPVIYPTVKTLRLAKEATPAVPRITWLGAANTWTFPSS